VRTESRADFPSGSSVQLTLRMIAVEYGDAAVLVLRFFGHAFPYIGRFHEHFKRLFHRASPLLVL
jgi:hypothetical protein